MVTKREAEFLKERALNFLKNGKELFRKKVFDIAAFNLEQFCQLYLKYKIFLKFGDFPKTHSLKTLISEFAKTVRNGERVRKFAEENIATISNLENAYITSRHIPIKFEKEEVKAMIGFATKFKNFVDSL